MFARLARGLLRLVAFCALLVTWCIAIEPSRLVMQDASVTPPTWSGPPLRVALLSDLHVGSPWINERYLRDLVRRTNAEHPDLVLLLGDYAINDVPGGVRIAPETWAPILGGLEAPLGVHAVLGNHDWWNDTRRIQRALEGAGIDVLDNASVRLRWHGSPFWLVGVGDRFSHHDRLKTAFASVPANANVLAMTHAPEVVGSMGTRADVLVAGHTHGGQVRLPWITDRTLRLPYTRGAYTVGSTQLFVTSGIGTSLFPIRFRVPPEVVLLEVHPTVASAQK